MIERQRLVTKSGEQKNGDIRMGRKVETKISHKK